MDEKKKKTQNKPVLKNKKTVTKVLSEKHKPISTKTPAKKKVTKSTKKTPIKKVTPKVIKKIDEELETKDIKKSVKKEIVVKKEEAPKKEVIKKEPKKKVTTKTKTKVATKPKQPKKAIEKVEVKKPKKKEEIPIKEKEKKKELVEKELDEKGITRKIKLKIKDKIFEEIDEEPVKEITEETRKRKNNMYFFTAIIILLVVSFYMAYSYSTNNKDSIKKYYELTYGEKVKLIDDSYWYVVEESGIDKNEVKLLAEKRLDMNSDGKYDNGDKLKYNSSGIDKYDKKDENSVAYYLAKIYKKELNNNNLKTVKDVRLLTSKEFVKLRGKMGYAYEWNTGNWLASDSLGHWWIQSSQNSKVYVVSPKGSYKLVDPGANYYIRPVITIQKSEIIEKVVDKD